MKTLEARIDGFLESPFTEAIDQAISKYHKSHADLIYYAKASKSKHQAWQGGYKYHLEQCIEIGETLYKAYTFPFTFRSVFLVLYFHDIEKIFKYGNGLLGEHRAEESRLAITDKERYYTEFLPAQYEISFVEEELNALKYIHGEGDDYCEERVMNELAGLCHACDTISARCFYNKRIITE
jgi:hypothetical protein